MVAVAEGTRAATAAVARSDPGARVVAVIVVGGLHMRGRDTAVARASHVNTAVAAKGVRNMGAIALMATATAGRNMAVASVVDLSTPVIAVMPMATV